MCWPTNECMRAHTQTRCNMHTALSMCSVTPTVCSKGWFQCEEYIPEDAVWVKHLSRYLSASFTPRLFPICTNLEIQTFLTLWIIELLRGAFLKIHSICSLFFSLVWGNKGFSSMGFFLRHASHGWLRADKSLVLHQPVDVMLGTMVTSWHLKNICYAQQGLLCVPVCHNLDRKGRRQKLRWHLLFLCLHIPTHRAKSH